MTGIVFRKTFDDFLDDLPKDKRVILEQEIHSFVNGELDSTPRECIHIKDRDKLLFGESGIIVFYDVKKNEDDLEFIDGCSNQDRVA